MRVPFIVYIDFELFLKPINMCQPNPSESYTNKYQKHIPSSFNYYIKCFDDNFYTQDPVWYTAENEDDDVAQIFVNTLEADIKRIYNKLNFPKKMILTNDESKRYQKATTCHICDDKLNDRAKVWDHCH